MSIVGVRFNDIEGNELNVLKSINFKYFNIKVICVEIINYKSLGDSKIDLLVDLLYLNIIKLRFFPSVKSVSQETVEGLGQSIYLN